MSPAADRGMRVGSLLPIGTSGTRVHWAQVPGHLVERESVARVGDGAPVRTETTSEPIPYLRVRLVDVRTRLR
uniref:Uncharacterized protein n=1 Tax=Peronospora matthiolae TaxID=2874970 RepID=A0AAV1T226_9STRA